MLDEVSPEGGMEGYAPGCGGYAPGCGGYAPG